MRMLSCQDFDVKSAVKYLHTPYLVALVTYLYEPFLIKHPDKLVVGDNSFTMVYDMHIGMTYAMEKIAFVINCFLMVKSMLVALIQDALSLGAFISKRTFCEFVPHQEELISVTIQDKQMKFSGQIAVTTGSTQYGLLFQILS